MKWSKLKFFKSRKFLWLAAGILLGAAAAASTALERARKLEPSSVTRGDAIASRLGCFACHGPAGTLGIPDFAAKDGSVPSWTLKDAQMYVRSEKEIREWILYGAPLSEKQSRITSKTPSSQTPERLIPMPAYKELLSPQELEDLVAYFKAVSGWHEEMPDAAYEGWKVAGKLGCFGCHGPSGRGGNPNPGSFKGAIIPWDSADFEDLVRSEDELRQWILDGQIKRLTQNPFARHFLNGQKIKMPAYRRHLSPEQLKQVVEYIQWLRAH